MAKQQFTIKLSPAQVAQACETLAAGMIDISAFSVEASVPGGVSIFVKATKRRARKAKAPKVAAIPKVAA